MKNINQIFSNMKTPDSWKEKLYAKIGEEKSAERPKIKKLAAVAAAAAAVFTVTVTAAALTGFFDFGDILRGCFDDDISAAKIETGAYQELSEYAENDLVSLKVSAFMGDYSDSYVILEAKLKDDAPKDFERIALDVKIFDETVTNPEKYAFDRYYGVPEKDENGDTVYIFKVRVYPYWSKNAVENNVKLLVDVTHVCFEADEFVSFTRQPADLQLSFAPDKNVLTEYTCIEPNREVSVNGEACTIEKFIPSDYVTRILIGYTVPDSLGEITNIWEMGCIYGETITGIPNEKVKSSYDSCPFKLVVDGENVPYIGEEFNGYEKPFRVTCYTTDNGTTLTNSFTGILSFEPFDFQSAESVVIEIEGSEPVIIK
ncbi:MAG: hypothetical protein J6C96_07790 [Oscillospiraceae bacterium]|nr:hypothetical protein [Oscillospiraceae bacterium]